MKTIVIAFATFLSCPALAAADGERWIATSHTAMAITGDITLSPNRLTMAGKSLPLRAAADLPAFQSAGGPVAARLLRVTRPSDPVLLHGNRLCRARWIVAWQDHRFGQTNLNMDVFSGDEAPAGENAAGLCGTYLYSRP